MPRVASARAAWSMCEALLAYPLALPRSIARSILFFYTVHLELLACRSCALAGRQVGSNARLGRPVAGTSRLGAALGRGGLRRHVLVNAHARRLGVAIKVYLVPVLEVSVLLKLGALLLRMFIYLQ
jgi:hypothetical protein